jgi:hypothetical protein
MTHDELIEISDMFDNELIYPTEFEDTIIGYCDDKGIGRLIIDENAIIKQLTDEGCTEDEAWDHYSYNIIRSLDYQKNPPIIMRSVL